MDFVIVGNYVNRLQALQYHLKPQKLLLKRVCVSSNTFPVDDLALTSLYTGPEPVSVQVWI